MAALPSYLLGGMLTKPLILSASSTATFLRCGQQWYYAYVAGIKAPPSLKAARGIALHRAVEVNMAQKVTSHEDVELDVMIDAFDESWTGLAQDGFVVEEGEDPGQYKDSGYQMTFLHRQEVSPTIQPVWVERPVQFSLGDGVVWSGQVDLADEMGRVRDTKSTARKPRPEQYMLNMTGYALAARQATGENETDIVLDYLVATKSPYYLPVFNGGPVSDDRIVSFANTVEAVAGSIKEGRFVPNGISNGACSWCGYLDICEYAQR